MKDMKLEDPSIWNIAEQMKGYWFPLWMLLFPGHQNNFLAISMESREV